MYQIKLRHKSKRLRQSWRKSTGQLDLDLEHLDLEACLDLENLDMEHLDLEACLDLAQATDLKASQDQKHQICLDQGQD